MLDLRPMKQPLSSRASIADSFDVSFQTLRLADYMLKKTMGLSAPSNPQFVSQHNVPAAAPLPLDFALSPASLRAIAHAETAFDRLVDAHEVSSGQLVLRRLLLVHWFASARYHNSIINSVPFIGFLLSVPPSAGMVACISSMSPERSLGGGIRCSARRSCKHAWSGSEGALYF